MKNPLLAVMMIPFGLVSTAIAQEKFTPTSEYKELRISNHVILFHPELEKHPEEVKQLVAELKLQIGNIHKVLSKEKLKHLEAVRIWVEWNREPKAAAVFHPNPAWLKNNGINPDKADGIEICHTKNFINWTKAEQPWMLMHELAHAYHENVLNNDYKPIKEAYDRVIKAKLYDSVDNVRGVKVKAYATADAHEFFSEMTEAYLGKNDFFPFNRAELEKHDPETFALMKKIWDK